MEDLLFYLFAFVVIGSASVVVLSKNIMYSAFSLLFTFFGVAGLYVLLFADFVALTQIMVYIGGILVLIIFGVLLTTKITGVDIKSGTTGKVQLITASVVVVIIAISLILLFTNVEWVNQEFVQPNTTIDSIGFAFMTKYLLPFEIAAVLLLIALVGATLIARRK
ncbi:MAG: NADH-quinone oxidoreductase subunit J [Ignavibacteria bacterium]|nr:NADH-quinone oxidoreductase subunit J [Ignavibacteria bacterium]